MRDWNPRGQLEDKNRGFSLASTC